MVRPPTAESTPLRRLFIARRPFGGATVFDFYGPLRVTVVIGWLETQQANTVESSASVQKSTR